jgi:hypothetical protein
MTIVFMACEFVAASFCILAPASVEGFSIIARNKPNIAPPSFEKSQFHVHHHAFGQCPVFVRMLRNLSAILDKAEQHAESRKFDVAVLLGSRLAPDMLPFTRQVLIACDSAKFAVSRLSGVDAPSFPDTEKTIAELKERIAKTSTTSSRSRREDQRHGGRP